ncbi:hypothetical protein D049_3075A, partial [Vibrio parahaemolyticus VPTS-2010]
MACHP